MDSITVEVEIEHGKLTARQPHLLPESGIGLMTILSPANGEAPPPSRVKLPLVRCAAGTQVNPTAEELDVSLWD